MNNRQKIENGYTFKVICNLIKKNYKWISICVGSDEQDTYNDTALIGFVVNPKLCFELNGWKLNDYMKIYLDKNIPVKGVLSYIFDISIDEEDEITSGIENIFSIVKSSSAIPDNLKFNTSSIEIDGFYVYFNDVVIPDNFFS